MNLKAARSVGLHRQRRRSQSANPKALFLRGNGVIDLELEDMVILERVLAPNQLPESCLSMKRTRPFKLYHRLRVAFLCGLS